MHAAEGMEEWKQYTIDGQSANLYCHYLTPFLISINPLISLFNSRDILVYALESRDKNKQKTVIIDL